jgi:hypothetical protein
VMLAVGAYMQAYEAAHHHRIVADRMRELTAKMAERSGGQPQRDNRAEGAVDYEPAPARNTPAAAGTANARLAASPRPALRSIPGGNSEINRLDKARTARVG